VGGLQLFRKPAGAGPEYLSQVRSSLLEETTLRQDLSKRPARPVNTLGNIAWVADEDLELDYHFRHSALPEPGRIRGLLEVTSRWHSTLLDRHRPLWEVHLVEGLSDDRFAIYSKIHHSVLDGVSALRQLQSVLSDDPDNMDCPSPWGSRPGKPGREPARPRSMLRAGLETAEQLAGVAPAAVRIANEAFREQRLTLPMQAPRTMLKDRKSTRLNSSHVSISYAVFCLKKKR